MNIQAQHKQITAEEYLKFENSAETKNEFYRGEIVAMTGGSINHNVISVNITRLFGRIRNPDCLTLMADVKLKVNQDFFYPDVMVVCTKDDESKHYKTAPVLIVEVLSKSTSKLDHTYKRLRYQNIPSVEDYVLVEQDQCMITVISRKDAWRSSYYYLGDEITFESLGVTVLVEEIYYQVDNEDVITFLQQNSQTSLP